MSTAVIDFQKEIIEDAVFCGNNIGDKQKVRAAENGATLVEKKAIGNSKVVLQNIPRGHYLLSSGRLLRTLEDVAARCKVDLVLEFSQ